MKARKHLETSFPGVSLDSLRGVRLLSDRTFGDDYLFPASLVEACLSQYVDEGSAVSQAEASLAFKEVLSLNLDWSLTDSHVALTRSWSQLIDALAPALADSRDAQQGLIAGLKLGKFVAAETRGGPIMTAVHGDRIRCLHSIVNTSWPYDITFDQLLDFIAPLKIIITHEIHNPLSSVTGLAIPPFHRPLLEIIYFCAQKALSLDPMKLSAAKKSVLSSSFTSAVLFAIDGLRVAFEKATELQSEDLDADIQLLVSVFSVCIRHELGVGLSIWLARLQSTNLIRASLDLFSRSDAAGVQYPAILRIRPSPLYSLAVLQLHQALARLPSSAERLAHEGIMGSYAMNGLTPALETALVDVTHVGHHAWCAIVAVVARITEVLGPTGSHFVDAEVVGFVQLYGVQLSRTLTWRLGDNLTLSLLREMEAVISLFHAIAISTSVATSNSSGEILRAYGEKALFLVQQLNAAVSYPNQLAGQLLAMSPIEGAVFQQEADLGTIQSSIDYLDKGDRPLLASVIQTLLRLTSTLLTTLVLANGGDMLLMRTDNARPPDLPLMSPVSIHDLPNSSAHIYKHFIELKSILRRASDDGYLARAGQLVDSACRSSAEAKNPCSSSGPFELRTLRFTA
jgi:nuclear pore complex protein Nup188